MEKVKLPREVAEAIESLSKKWGRKAFLQSEFLKNATHPEVPVIRGYFKPFDSADHDGFDKLVAALYIGFEVEETPEDKVRNRYNELTNDLKGFHPENNNRFYIDGEMRGIRATLDILNIKIEGVNA